MNVIDTATFAQLRDTTGKDFAAELVRTFLDDAPQLIASLRAAAGSGDAAAFRRAAHSLKSNSSTFGATALAAIARELENGGLGTAGRLAELETSYAAAAGALRELAHG